VPATKVAAALQSAHQQLERGQGPPSKSAMDAALAKALGVPKAKVSAAMAAIGPPGPSAGAAAPQNAPVPAQSS
jgi:hypothetical protein